MALLRAIELQPNYANAHYNLGVALLAQKRPAEAEKACRRAVQLQPDFAYAHGNLGLALLDLKRPAEAEKALREAIRIQPDFALALFNLGNVLSELKRPVEAEKAYRKVIERNHDDSGAYNNLGTALRDQKRPAEAEKAFREAIRIQPDLALAYNNLGWALTDQKKLEVAVEAYRKADELQPGNLVFRNDLRRAEHLLRLDRKLTACLEGKAPFASPGERLELAEHCGYYRERPRTALSFCLEAFAEAPRLADDLNGEPRYHAACFAALAAAGKGHDGARLTEEARAGLRLLAFAWLRADLEAWRALLDDKKGPRALVRQRLAHRLADEDLAGVRDDAALARLPKAERAAWAKLWADVRALRKRSEAGG